MCGIAGSYGKTSDGLSAVLRSLEHRGPDGKGVKHLFNGTLGHTRLAIIDVHGGDQPLVSMDKRRWLVANGEIYNHRELRAHFPDYDFTTDSDSEVILALYERHGVRAAEYLDGMFAFALVDGDDFYMARDPIGIKPLYYGWQGETLHFASELKALQGEVDEIIEFPPGHWYSSKHGMNRYYDLGAVGTDAMKRTQTAPATIADVRESLTRAVRKRLMADVPVGVYLSGGLDSTIVAALVAREIPNVHSFAVGVETSADLRHAREAAADLGTQHHEYVYTLDEMLAHLGEVIYYLESFDPSLVRSAIPNYFLARMTREYVTVVLTGEGADELYAGYHYLKQHLRQSPQRLHDELIHLTGTLYNCNLQRCDRMTMAHSIEGRVPFLDTEFIATSFAVPVDDKIHGPEEVEKWALRKAFEDIVPPNVAWRVKEQFSKGAGSSEMLIDYAETHISDEEFAAEVAQIKADTGHDITTKEMLLYYREFARHFDPRTAALVKLWAGHDVPQPVRKVS